MESLRGGADKSSPMPSPTMRTAGVGVKRPRGEEEGPAANMVNAVGGASDDVDGNRNSKRVQRPHEQQDEHVEQEQEVVPPSPQSSTHPLSTTTIPKCSPTSGILEDDTSTVDGSTNAFCTNAPGTATEAATKNAGQSVSVPICDISSNTGLANSSANASSATAPEAATAVVTNIEAQSVPIRICGTSNIDDISKAADLTSVPTTADAAVGTGEELTADTNDGVVVSEGGSGNVGVKKCEVCGERDRRYCCPRCGKLTCSLPCCLQHKKVEACNGRRDRVGFVGVKDFSDSQLRSDFNFLEDALRCMDGGRRDLSSRPGIAQSIERSLRGRRGNNRMGRGRGRGRCGRGSGHLSGGPEAKSVQVEEEEEDGSALGILSGQTNEWLKGRSPRLQRLVREAALRSTRLLLMPEGMARRQKNTSTIANVKKSKSGGRGGGRGGRRGRGIGGRGGRAGLGRGAGDTAGEGGVGVIPVGGSANVIREEEGAGVLPKGGGASVTPEGKIETDATPEDDGAREGSGRLRPVPGVARLKEVGIAESATIDQPVPVAASEHLVLESTPISESKETAVVIAAGTTIEVELRNRGESKEGAQAEQVSAEKGSASETESGVGSLSGEAASRGALATGTASTGIASSRSSVAEMSPPTPNAATSTSSDKKHISQTGSPIATNAVSDAGSSSISIGSGSRTHCDANDATHKAQASGALCSRTQSRELLEKGEPEEAIMGKLKAIGQSAVGSSRDNSNARIVWRVEWVFSGIASSEKAEVEGLTVVDEGVPEAMSLHEALARHLDPREGNAPLRHRLRTFSKPWEAMVRAFPAKNTTTVSSRPAEITLSSDHSHQNTASSRRSSTTTAENVEVLSSSKIPTLQGTRNCIGGDAVGSDVSGRTVCAIAAAGSGKPPFLRLFLRRVPCPAKRPQYWEVYPEDSLGSALGGKTVIEFPTIYVSLPGADSGRFQTLVKDMSCISGWGGVKAKEKTRQEGGDDMNDDEEESSSEDDSSSSESDESSSEDSEDSDDSDDSEMIYNITERRERLLHRRELPLTASL